MQEPKPANLPRLLRAQEITRSAIGFIRFAQRPGAAPKHGASASSVVEPNRSRAVVATKPPSRIARDQSSATDSTPVQTWNAVRGCCENASSRGTLRKLRLSAERAAERPSEAAKRHSAAPSCK